jgi:hypothetical protein
LPIGLFLFGLLSTGLGALFMQSVIYERELKEPPNNFKRNEKIIVLFDYIRKVIPNQKTRLAISGTFLALGFGMMLGLSVVGGLKMGFIAALHAANPSHFTMAIILGLMLSGLSSFAGILLCGVPSFIIDMIPHKGGNTEKTPKPPWWQQESSLHFTKQGAKKGARWGCNIMQRSIYSL